MVDAVFAAYRRSLHTNFLKLLSEILQYSSSRLSHNIFYLTHSQPFTPHSRPKDRTIEQLFIGGVEELLKTRLRIHSKFPSVSSVAMSNSNKSYSN